MDEYKLASILFSSGIIMLLIAMILKDMHKKQCNELRNRVHKDVVSSDKEYIIECPKPNDIKMIIVINESNYLARIKKYFYKRTELKIIFENLDKNKYELGDVNIDSYAFILNKHFIASASYALAYLKKNIRLRSNYLEIQFRGRYI